QAFGECATEIRPRQAAIAPDGDSSPTDLAHTTGDRASDEPANCGSEGVTYDATNVVGLENFGGDARHAGSTVSNACNYPTFSHTRWTGLRRARPMPAS